MAQYDIIITQNVSALGVEFAEKVVNLPKGALLSGATDGSPVAIPPGTNGQIPEADSNVAGGIKWVNKDVTHTQNTDTGTTQAAYDILSGGNGVKLKVNAGVLELKSIDDASFKSFKADGGSFNDVLVANAPTLNSHAANKAYVDNLLGANNAMQFKGTIGTGGTYTIVAFNALTTYNAGWTYEVITAGTIKGNICKAGDSLMCMVSRSGSGAVDADWTAKEANQDGIVIGPVSASDSYPALFDGVSGKLLKVAASPLGSAAFVNTNTFASAAQGLLADTAIQKAVLAANSILYATTISTPAALDVPVSTMVGRKSTGNIVALIPAEIRTIINVADGATSNTKATGAEIDTGTDDTKFATAKAIADSKIVKGPASAGDNYLATFDGITGKLLKDSGKRTGDFKGNWVAAPSGMTSTGNAGDFALDSNFLYLCPASNTWARVPIARNW